MSDTRKPHRPVLLRADRHDDGAAHRQHRHQRRRPGEPRREAAGFEVHRARAEPDARRTGAQVETLDAYLARNGIVGISGVDTRRLTRISSGTAARRTAASGRKIRPSWSDKARSAPNMEGAGSRRPSARPKTAIPSRSGRGDWRVSFDPGVPMTEAPRVRRERPFRTWSPLDFGAKRRHPPLPPRRQRVQECRRAGVRLLT